MFSNLAEDLLILLEKKQCYKARRPNSNVSRGLESVSGNLVISILIRKPEVRICFSLEMTNLHICIFLHSKSTLKKNYLSDLCLIFSYFLFWFSRTSCFYFLVLLILIFLLCSQLLNYVVWPKMSTPSLSQYWDQLTVQSSLWLEILVRTAKEIGMRSQNWFSRNILLDLFPHFPHWYLRVKYVWGKWKSRAF